MRMPFESEGAAKLNRDIFETIYFGAVEASVKVRTSQPTLDLSTALQYLLRLGWWWWW